jgi:DNA polymerase III epsilon subunit-like protein
MKFRPKRQRKLAATKCNFAPRILIFDIETSPMHSWHWRTFKENISPVQVEEYSKVLCWAAKWLGDKGVMFERVKDYRDDRAVCESIWDLFDQSDIVIAHNGRAFDVKFLQARWIDLGLNPPSPYKVVDTVKTARKQIGIPSKALEALLRYFEIGGKLPHTGFQMWLDCMAGKKAAWDMMREYNINDTTKLEKLYLLIRSWDNRHPNVALMYDDDERRCMVCGGRNLTQIKHKTAKTAVSEFDSYRCDACGKVMRSGKRHKNSKEMMRNVL